MHHNRLSYPDGVVAVTYIDRVLTCIDCGAEFVFPAGEQEFFAEKNFRNEPKRCKACRMRRKDKTYKVRPETKITCAECGKETTVPFKPTQGKPILCRSCFKKSKEQTGQGGTS
jgi:CxxC-x17-CxxC domain-containing protein